MVDVQAMMPEDLERAALSTLLVPDAAREAIALGVDEHAFQVDAHVAAWNYLIERAAVNKPVTVEDVRVVCGVVLTEGVSDAETLLAELVKQSKKRRARRAMYRRAEELAEGKVDTAISGLIGDLGELATANKAHQTSFDSDAHTRLQRLLDRADMVERGEVYGITTGLYAFDSRRDTWKPGEVVAIQGATNAGKSWVMLKLCVHAYLKENQKILFLSPESTTEDIELRADPIFAQYLGFELSNVQLRNATFDREMYSDYIDALRGLGREDGWVTRDSGSAGVFTMNDIIALAREHRPGILAIDGFHLIRGEGKSWESIKNAAESIKGLAQDMGIVVLATSQAQRSASLANDDAPETGHAAYGMALNEAANRVISIAQWTGKKSGRVFKVPKHRDGEVITKTQYLTFDVDRGIIEQLVPRIDGGDVDF